MNVLVISNSFGVDATRYLHRIARADGEDINVATLYIGGCPLEKHYRNMIGDERTTPCIITDTVRFFRIPGGGAAEPALG